MNRSLLPTLSFLITGLFMGSPAIAQDLPQTAVIGRPPEAAPLENAAESERLPDAFQEVPDVKVLDSIFIEDRTDFDDDQKRDAKVWAHVAVFEGPCHFAERLNDTARTLLIYEGMQVAVDHPVQRRRYAMQHQQICCA